MSTQDFDPVDLAIMGNRLDAIVREMTNTVIIEEPTTTIVVEPGMTGRLSPQGNYVFEFGAKQ